MNTIPEPDVRATVYEVCCLPADDWAARKFTLRVEYRQGNRWAVTDGWVFYGRDGQKSQGYSWRDGSQEPRTEADFAEVAEGREAWRGEYWHDLDTALALAKKHAPLMTSNGWTVAAVLAAREEQES